MKTSDFDPISTKVFDRQIKNAILFVLVVFGILILRLWFLQIVNGSNYRTKSEHNRIRLQGIPPFRGRILDRNGKTLVDNRPSYSLYIIPEVVQDRKKLLKNLDKLVGLNQKMAELKLDKASHAFLFKPISIKEDISRDDLAVLETHRFNLPGVMINVKPQRHYIYGNIASHLLGHLGEISENQLKDRQYSDNYPGDLIGKSGVEGKWQPLLNGSRGGEQVEVDAAGRKIRVIAKKPPVSGENVCLTIDIDLQTLAEKALQEKRGAIVAIDPNDGEVLALASSPSFDPNLFVGNIDKATWRKISCSKDFPLQNRALSGQYPPGSIFKIVIALAGLEEGVIDPEEEIFCNGVFTLGGHKYRGWKKYGHGKIKLHRAIVESCDIYFYKMGKRLGINRIARYAKKFGLGKMTGFDAGKEGGGLIPTNKWKLKRFGVPWQAGETISVSIGQSFVLVTPIQMATLISTVFNGGIIYKPQVTKWIGTSKEEKGYSFAPKIAGKAGIRREYMELVKKSLVGVVNEPHGTGWRAKMKNITVAGKTGTAQVVSLEKEKGATVSKEIPWKYRDHAWFVALAPAEKPRIALAVVIEHGGHGGSAAAPIAKKIIKAYLKAPE